MQIKVKEKLQMTAKELITDHFLSLENKLSSFEKY